MKEPGKIIGIVAGAGPFAGLDLQQKILSQTTAEQDQDHLTVISLSQPSAITDRTAFLLGETAVNPAYAIFDQLRQLAAAGAEIAAIPCNTAHAPAIYDEITAQLAAAGQPIQFLHLIAETVSFINTHFSTVETVGVLSTTGTRQAGIYPHWLEPAGLRVVSPAAEMQAAVHRAIYDPVQGVKVSGGGTTAARAWLLAGVQDVARQGAQIVILGCTEIPLALPEPAWNGLPLIDPALALARALIREAAPRKLKKWGEPEQGSGGEVDR